MGRIEGIGHLAGEVHDAPRRHRPLLDQFADGDALESLHDDEGLAVVLAELMYGADVRVLEGGGQAGLAPESAQPFLRRGGLGVEDLDRDLAPQARIFGAVDLAHATHPEQAEEAIVRQVGCNHGGQARVRVRCRERR